MTARFRCLGAIVVALGASGAVARVARADSPRMTLFAGGDDDDHDGALDRDSKTPAQAHDIEWMSTTGTPFQVRSIKGDGVRVIAGQRAMTAASFASGLRAKRIGLQGLLPGKASVDLGSRFVDLDVCGVFASDSDGDRVDLATSHASISRTLPSPVAEEADEGPDRDALSWTFVCPRGALPPKVRISSSRPSGEPLDGIEAADVASIPCPSNTSAALECGGTGPIRASPDLVDRAYSATADRSLRAEVGGRIVLSVLGKKAASIRVGGPRKTAVGPIDRYRARLRFHVVRESARKPSRNEVDDAKEMSRDEARTASMLWGQCGIHFGADTDVSVDVVDPPGPYLVALGCDLGLPASGGTVALQVDGKPVRVTANPDDAPIVVARAVANAIESLGFVATLSPNARIAEAALRTADVLVHRKNGQFAELTPAPDAPLSADPTLGVCLGEVNLDDGLAHFDDLDAVAGTLEERTLIKAYQDDDPATIEVFVVPSFSKSGRIGESFIDSDGSSIQNAIIVDRAGIRAGARSYALAHEIGHVLLDLPGHPDDFGVDRPWYLMDADAADPTIFGPRRLSVAECERAVRQSGPGSAIQLLSAWPLYGAKPGTPK